MLSAIKFNRQLRRVTDEISDVTINRHLAAETCPIQSVIAQFGPKNAFSVGGIPAEGAGVRTQPGRYFPGGPLLFSHRDLHCGDAPTPALPRKRGRELKHPRGSTATDFPHELSPPASVGKSSGRKP